MKSLRLLFLIVFFLPNFSLTQWIPIPSGTTSFLVDISFVSPDIGWAAGHNKTLIKTTDAGQSWVPQSPGNNDDILSVFFITDQLGWVGTSTGLIYKTTNGGSTWTQQYNADYRWITKIYFVNENVGFATIHKYDTYPSNRNGAIIKTTNGGQSWVIKNQIYYDGFQCIYFTDPENGFAVGTWGLFTRTTNGGENWTSPISLTSHWLHTVFFIDKFTGFAAGGGFNNALIFKTTNSGSNWTLVRNTYEGGILGITFLDERNGWACGYNGTMLRTFSGGEGWLAENSSINTAIGEMVVFENSAYAVGEFGVVLGLDPNYQYPLTVIRPNGGEVFYTGTQENIYWIWSDSSNVTIEYSFGAGWNLIAEDIPNTGHYLWTVPEVNSNNVLLKISKADNTGIFALSTHPFAIRPYIPVELVSFNAAVSTNNITLTWSTATEVNNFGFEVQRSVDNSEFLTIEFVNGYGTTTEPNNYSYVDDNVVPGKYFYRLKQVDFDGTFEYFDIVEVEFIGPTEFKLNQNYPNPFNPSTVISYSIPGSEFVTLKIFDMLGNEVSVLVNEEQPAGTHNVEFNSTGLSSGTYFYRIQAGSFADSRKMILLK